MSTMDTSKPRTSKVSFASSAARVCFTPSGLGASKEPALASEVDAPWTPRMEWCTPPEAPQTPLPSPRQHPVATAKDYSQLHCIPKFDVADGRIKARPYPPSSDLQLQEIQKLLEEQRVELCRVADIFQLRLLALCQASCAAAPTSQALEQAQSRKHIEAY